MGAELEIRIDVAALATHFMYDTRHQRIINGTAFLKLQLTVTQDNTVKLKYWRLPTVGITLP